MTVWPVLAALPWLAVPLAISWRMRGAPSLADEPAAVSDDAPLVSVIIPARDEARNIARCMQSVLRSTYPQLEVIVVDDRSADGTSVIAEEIARRDPRARVIAAPPLPEGWFGKQWACAAGAGESRGTLLCFTDADTVHAPELLARSVHAVRARHLDLFSVAGRQELGTFWERTVQPLVFTLLAARYGGPRTVNRSPRAVDKIANGQFMLFTRAAYDALGTHASVRDKAAEDLALAQRAFRSGMRTELVLGLDFLATRMYTSLGELVRGWMKNVYAAGVDTVPGGAVGRALLPLLLLAAPAAMLFPVVVLALAFAGVAGSAAAVWAVLSTAFMLLWWGTVYLTVGRLPPSYAFTFPLAAAVVMYIMLRATARGRYVEWKGRAYHAG